MNLFSVAEKLGKTLGELCGWPGPLGHLEVLGWACFSNPDGLKLEPAQPFDPYFSKEEVAKRELKFREEHPEAGRDGFVVVKVKRSESDGKDAERLLRMGVSRQDEHGKRLRRELGIKEPNVDPRFVDAARNRT